MTRHAFALILLCALGCTNAAPVRASSIPAPPPPVPAEEMVDHVGDSAATAVAVPEDAAGGGEEFENRWIFEMYGRFRRNGGGTGTMEGRRYNVVKIELASGEKKTVYFDITELWARSLHERPRPR